MKKIIVVSLIIISMLLVFRWNYIGKFPNKYDGGTWWRSSSNWTLEKVSEYNDMALYKAIEINRESVDINGIIESCYDSELILQESDRLKYYDGGCNGHINILFNGKMYYPWTLLDKKQITITDLKYLGYPMYEIQQINKSKDVTECLYVEKENQDGELIGEEVCVDNAVYWYEFIEKEYLLGGDTIIHSEDITFE